VFYQPAATTVGNPWIIAATTVGNPWIIAATTVGNPWIIAATTVGNPWITICNNKATTVYFFVILNLFLFCPSAVSHFQIPLVQSLKFLSLFRFYLMYFHPLKIMALFSLD
jgi:hypothetical protein